MVMALLVKHWTDY